MTQFKRIKGNFKEIVSRTGLIKLMPKVMDEELYSKTMTDIFKDLGRSYFVETKDNTFDDFLNAWTQDDLFKSYTQGNITAEIFSLLFQHFIFTSPQFVNSEKNRTDTEESRNVYIKTEVSLNFSYFDDKNRLCGFCLSYSKEDPSLWFAAKIRNVTASPERKQVSIICHTDILDCPQDELIDDNNACTTIGKLLGSASLQKQFEHIILADGTINNELFDHELNTIIKNKKNHNPINQAKVKIKENQYKALYNAFINGNTEYTAIKENPQQIHVKDTYTKYLEEREKLKHKQALSDNLFQEALEITKTQSPQVFESSFFKRNKISLILGTLGLLIGLGLVISGSLLLIPIYATSLIILGVSIILFALVVSSLKIVLNEKPVMAYSQLIKKHEEEQSKLHAQLETLNESYEQTQKIEQTNRLKELEVPFEKTCRKSLNEPFTYNSLFFTPYEEVLAERHELISEEAVNSI